MARNTNGPLTRHEELRYSYLLKNLAYLNGKEAAEFNYLQSKIDAHNAQATYDAYRESSAYYPEENNSYESSYDWDGRDYKADENSQFPDYESYYDNPDLAASSTGYTAQGLPEYPEDYDRQQAKLERSRRKADKQAERAQRPKVKGSRRKKIKRALQFLALFLFLLLAIMGIFLWKGYNEVTSGADGKSYQPAVQEVFNGEDAKDGTNILVLGSDQRISQGSSDARTDTIMVVNVGNSDNKIKMVSFMRDTLVNIEGASYDDYNADLKLNTAFNIGEQNNNQGAELMRQTLKRNFDIDIKYYVMVDFQTFAEGIDTLFPDGVKIDAKFSTVDGVDVSSVEVPDDLNMDENGNVPTQTIKEGEQMMDGRTLLNYARFRKDDEGDYGRTKRQQQVLQAVISQVKNPARLFTGAQAIGKVYALTSTNIGWGYLAGNGLDIVSDASNGVETTTVPEEGDWIDTYDMYGGSALEVDFEAYKTKLEKLGLR
ncbi:LCP family protein [Streptococcus dentiloxodontae]